MHTFKEWESKDLEQQWNYYREHDKNLLAKNNYDGKIYKGLTIKEKN